MTHPNTIEIPNLRRRLVTLDCAALMVTWLPILLWELSAGMALWKFFVLETLLIPTGLALLAIQGLYLSRVASSRVEEMRCIVRSSIALGVLQAGLLHAMGVDLRLRWLVLAPLTSVVLLVWFRGGYRAWLSASRAAGRYLRDVVVVGVNDDAADLVDMLTDHPEAGFRVCGVVGDLSAATANGLSTRHRGTIDDLLMILERDRVKGVVAVAGATPARQLRPLMAQLEEAGIHIQVSNGLHGMAHRRLRATPVAYQSLYYLEPAVSGTAQRITKRALDIVLATVTLIVTAPAIALIALAIKCTDRGPVFFRQLRVGKGGRTFDMLKFRSMVPDAEAMMAELSAVNDRNCPLFKLLRDPRVTPIGRFIRATSLDELPQLINVLRGQMSIVGPRPALPAEVARFDDRLLDRLRMPPGITGLWQVEARDNPNFGAYRRLDLFYVDNWTLTLDLIVLVATIEQVLSRAVRTLLGEGDDHVQVAALPTGLAGASDESDDPMGQTA